MTEILQFALLGLGAGAAYALLGLGVVMIFRGSGVLNLAHGAFAMLAAYLCNQLRAVDGWATAPAIVVSVLAVVALGLITYYAVLRRLRHSSPLSRLIATLGVLLIVYAFATLEWGVIATLVTPILPSGPVTIAHGLVVGQDRLWMLGIALALTGILVSVWRWTRIGWAVEAVAQNQRAAAAQGLSPNMVSASTWAVGAGLAGIAGILISPITQLNVENLTLLIVPALAAALVGGFRSFPLTLLGGLVIGILEAEIGNYVNIVGAADALPFLLIIVVLVFRGSSLPLRGDILDRLPGVGIGRIDPRKLIPAMVAILLIPVIVTAGNWLDAFTATFAVAIILLSLVVLTGYAGQISLAQYALAGIGALLCARLVANLHFPFEIALILSALGTSVVGLTFALPALRTRGVNLAVVTLGLGVATQDLIFNNPTFAGQISGISVGGQTFLGFSVGPYTHPGRYLALTFLLFVVLAIAVANLRRGRTGLRLLAVRGNERAAAASGINVLGAKLHAFAVSGALAGLGGAMLTFTAPSVTFGAFDPLNSITALADAVIGGIGFVLGSVFGGQLAPSSFGSLLAVQFPNITQYLALLAGVGLLIALMDAPDGVVALTATRLRRRLAKIRHREESPAPRPPVPTALREAISDVDASSSIQKVAPKPLSITDVTVRYGGNTAVDRVSLEVSPGQIVGLIGPNGAGKTSLMDAVTGFARYTGGVAIGGQAVDGWSSYRRARAGMVRSFQGLELFLELTTLENLQAASDDHALLATVTDLARPKHAALSPAGIAAVREFGLGEHLDRYPDELSYGQRRLVAIARAVAAEPSILLLDEPVAGLDDAESEEFAHLVRKLADDRGIGILVIEHAMDFVMKLCDEIVVIDFGREIARGTPDQVRNNPAAIAAYLGDEVESAPATPTEPVRAPVRSEGTRT